LNLLLFAPDELAAPLPRGDARAVHLLEVLRRLAGDSFDAGLVDGPRGKGTLVAIGPDPLTLTFTWGAPPPPLAPITLIVGLPRPQTARKILHDATTLGVAAMHFVVTEKGEPGYAQSPLWHTGEWRRHLLAGAAQAFCTRLPAVTYGQALPATLAALPAATTRLALDNYEATSSLGAALALPGDRTPASVALALGPERGWSASDRDDLRTAGFTLVHLGPRVLRVETATLAAVAIVKAQRGFF